MEISTRQSDSATVVDLKGDISLHSSPQVRRTLLELLREKGVARLIINMKNVRYIDSSGVASLVEALKVARKANSRFMLCNLSPAAREVLELTKLIKVFEVHATEQDALQAS